MGNKCCKTCGALVSESDFEWIDDELDPNNPLCPPCSSTKRLSGEPCEFCDRPAEYEVELGFLCGDHHDDYCDGMLRD